LSVLTVY